MISEIFSHVFQKPAPDMPASDHYPLQDTTGVLLVSRLFRELALPFFLRAITITRSSDIAYFFNTQDGLFVGPEGEARWRHVQELSIVADILPPLRDKYVEDSTYTLPLSIPVFQRVRQLCILDPPDYKSPENTRAKVVCQAARDALFRSLSPAHRALVAEKVPYQVETRSQRRMHANEGCQSRFDESPAEDHVQVLGYEAAVDMRMRGNITKEHLDARQDFRLSLLLSLRPHVYHDRLPSLWSPKTVHDRRMRRLAARKAQPEPEMGLYVGYLRHPDQYPQWLGFVFEALETAESHAFACIRFVDTRSYPVHRILEIIKEAVTRWTRRNQNGNSMHVRQWSWDGPDGQILAVDTDRL
jgi:hypothetical protein